MIFAEFFTPGTMKLKISQSSKKFLKSELLIKKFLLIVSFITELKKKKKKEDEIYSYSRPVNFRLDLEFPLISEAGAW